MSQDARIVLVTASTADQAAHLGRAIVEERLAACANIVPGLRSIYRWQGAVHDEAEVLLLIKTTAALVERLTQRVIELHAYDTPEVVALPVVGGSAAYMQWIEDQVGLEEQA